VDPWSRRAVSLPLVIAGAVIALLIIPPIVLLAALVIIVLAAVFGGERGRRFAKRLVKLS
jgi:hypothetical protein